jgi:hypothetical protein
VSLACFAYAVCAEAVDPFCRLGFAGALHGQKDHHKSGWIAMGPPATAATMIDVELESAASGQPRSSLHHVLFVRFFILQMGRIRALPGNRRLRKALN